MRSHQATLLWLAIVALVLGWVAWRIPQAQAQTAAQANLVANGDWESGSLAEWETCGGVRLADRQAGAGPLDVYAGRYALRMGAPTDGSCGSIAFNDQLVARYRSPIVVPAGATGLTLSFRYSRVGAFAPGSTSWHLRLLLTTADNGAQVRIQGSVDADASGGWTLGRWELPPGDIAAARGRSFQLSFRVNGQLKPGDDLAYAIDDLAVLPATVRTPLTAAPPAALADTNTRPLLGLAAVNGATRLVRADLNGSDIVPVYEGRSDVSLGRARWSSDGKRFAVIDQYSQPEPNEPSSVNWAQVSALTLFNADGSRREVLHTTGKKLVPGVPAGCRPPRTGCARYDDPALDVVITDVDWSPGDDRMVINVCATQRYADGYQDDPICRLQTIGVAGGDVQSELIGAFGASWSRANRLLYRTGYVGLQDDPSHGIWESEPNLATTVRRQLFRHKKPVNEDVGATWAPDGRHFVTLRYTEGGHYDSAGRSQFSSAIMLFDREAPSTPRQLTLVDFGNGLSSPSWSPDGAYLLYSVNTSGSEWQTFWLDVASGATGLLTSDVIFAEWQPGVVLTKRVFVPGAAR